MLMTVLEIVARQVVVSSLVIVKSQLGDCGELGGEGVRLVMMLVRLVVVERLFQDLR